MGPYQQGTLDSLCGIYSLINADELVNGTNCKESEQLFVKIVRYLEKKKKLATFLSEGMILKDLKLILNEVIGDRILNKKLAFHGRPNPSLGEFWEEVEEFLDAAPKRAVILSLDGVHCHWTTIKEISAKQIQLFDSDGLCILNRSFCTTEEATNKRQHLIWPAQSLFLSN